MLILLKKLIRFFVIKKKLFLEGKDYLNSIYEFNDIDFDGATFYKVDSSELKDSYLFVISLLYNSPLSNFLVIKAKVSDVSTLLVSDGIVEWNNMFNNPLVNSHNIKLFHPIIHDVFLCVGKDECEYFNFMGAPTVQFLPKRMKPSVSRIGRASNEKFLITTANTAYFDDVEKDQLLELLKSLKSKLDLLGESYVFRIFDIFLQSELGLTAENNHIRGSFEDCLKEVDFVITAPSSISFLAMYHGKPLAHLIYRDSPQFIQAGWNITNLVSLESTINSMKSYDQDRMYFQEFQVSKYNTDNKNLDADLQQALEVKRKEDFKQFVDQNLYNMLDSKFNINFEYAARKLYLKFKKNKLFQFLRTNIR